MYRNTQSKNSRLLFAAMPIALIILFVLFGQLDAPRTNAQQDPTLTATASTSTDASVTDAGPEVTESATEAASTAPDVQRRLDEYASISHALQAQTIAEQSPFLAYALAIEAGRLENPPAESYNALLSMVYETRAITTFDVEPSAPVTIAITDDGSTVAALTFNNELVIIDMATRTELHRYLAPRGYIGGADFTPDGSQLILTIPENNLLVIWDVATGRASRLAVGEPFGLVEVSPDGQQVLLADFYTSETVLFDLNTRETVRAISGYEYNATKMVFSPDGTVAMIGYYDGEVIIIDLATGDALHMLALGDSQVTALGFSPSGYVAAVGLANGSLHLIVVDSGEVYYVDQYAHAGAINDLAFSDNDWLLATAGQDKRIVIMDTEFRTTLDEIVANPAGVTNVLFNADGNLVSSDFSGNVTLWSTTSYIDFETVYVTENASIWAAALSTNGRYAAVGGADGSISVIDLDTRERLWSLNVHTGYVYSLNFTPDGLYLFSGSGDGRAILWDLSTGQALRTFEVSNSQIYDSTISPDGKIGLVGTWNAGVWLYDIDPESDTFGEELFHFEALEGVTNSVAFSPDGSTAAAVTDLGELAIWDVATGEQLHSLHSESGRHYNDVAYLPDGERIAVLEYGQLVVIRDIASGEVVQQFTIETNSGDFVISPDGQTLLSYSERNLFLWNMETGQLIRRIENRFYENVTTLAFSGEGRHFIAASVDRNAQILTLPSIPELIHTLLSERYVPAITCEQRVAYRVEPYCDAEGTVPAATPMPTLTPTPVVTGSIPTLTPTGTSTPPATAVMATDEAEIGTQRGETEVGGGEVWTYDGTAGELLTIRVSADEPANNNEDRAGLYDTYLLLISPTGELLYAADDMEDGIVTDSYMEVTLPTTGVYQIEVRSWNDESGGAYTLELGNTPYATPTAFAG